MSLTESQLMLACVAFEKEKEKASHLFQFASSKVEKLLSQETEEWLRLGKEVSSQKILEKIADLKTPKGISFLREIHPAWILEKMSGESPFVLDVLSRYLPGPFHSLAQLAPRQ